MNKKVIVLLVVFVAVGVVAWWVINDNQPDSKMNFPDRDFAVENVDDIHRIFIADKRGRTVDLKRQSDDTWLLNDQHETFENPIDVILRTIKNLKVKYIPPKAAEDIMIRGLASDGIKVELYDSKGDNFKTFYVGGNTSDDLGTVFIMEGYSQPYVLHVPTQVGGIRSRFTVKATELMSRWIFTSKYEDIEKVSLQYPTIRNKSFVLQKEEKTFDVKPYYDITPEINAELLPAAAEAFLIGFEKLGAESHITDDLLRDSVSSQVPFVIISVKEKDKTSKEVALYPIYDMISEDYRKVDHVQYEEFVERYYALSSDGYFYIVQDHLFNKVLWGYDYFFDVGQTNKDLLN